MVVLTFTITDSKGRYVTGLKPSDFRILEDGIVQRVDPEGITVNLGRTEALLPPMEQVPREIYHKGERIRA